MITDLADAGTTVFLSTHILPVVEEVADTVGILYEGRLVAEDAPDTLTQRAETEETGTETQTLEDVFLELTGTDPAEGVEATNG
jgi:ABC-2 type transport system ATP-binding protein